MRPAINLLISATALLMASCSGARHHDDTPEKPVVVVCIAPLSYFAEGIGGDKVNVEVMAPAGTDPETYEPSMASLRSASQASVIFTTGLLPFEGKIARTVKESSGGKTLNQTLCDSLQLIMGTHGHDEADPHIWMSLRNARVMARTVCRALTRALPADSAYFRVRLAAMEHRLDSLDNVTATALAPITGSSFLIWHPSLSYFARDYGLQQVAIAAENKESICRRPAAAPRPCRQRESSRSVRTERARLPADVGNQWCHRPAAGIYIPYVARCGSHTVSRHIGSR